MIVLDPHPSFMALRAVAVLLLMVGATSAYATGKRVDLELMLAIDVSRSIDKHEAELQRQGTADALRNSQSSVPSEAAISNASPSHTSIIRAWPITKSSLIG